MSSLVRSGLPTRPILPLLQENQLNQADGDETDDGDDLVALFDAEFARLDSQVKCLSVSRNAVQQHLRRLRTTRVNQESTVPELSHQDGCRIRGDGSRGHPRLPADADGVAG